MATNKEDLKTVTMSMDEYHDLLKSIKDKNELIQKAINEGKIMIANILCAETTHMIHDHYIPDTFYGGLYYTEVINKNKVIEMLKNGDFKDKESVIDFNEEQLDILQKRQKKELKKKDEELEELDAARELKFLLEEEINSIKNAGFIERLSWLFGGIK